VLQRFDGSAWRDVARYHTMHDANAALDHAIGDGEEPGALRIVDATPSAAARALTVAGAAVVAVVVILLIWFWFVA
jgi:hypothetical protein